MMPGIYFSAIPVRDIKMPLAIAPLQIIAGIIALRVGALRIPAAIPAAAVAALLHAAVLAAPVAAIRAAAEAKLVG